MLQLAGRGWKVTAVDWVRRIASVEPSQQPGRSRWVGSPRALGFELCRSLCSLLAGQDPQVTLSRRALSRLAELREEMPFCAEDSSALVTDETGSVRWWTFAGLRANAVLAQRLRTAGEAVKRFDNFMVQLERAPSAPFQALAWGVDLRSAAEPQWEDWMKQVELKFGLCLPAAVAEAALVARLTSAAEANTAQQKLVRSFRVR